MIVQPGTSEGTSKMGEQLGKYQLVATLGQGGMGTVYLAFASGFGQFRKLLVVKELRQDLTRQPGFVSMFMDEAKLAARLEHPNVVQTFEASEVDDRYFLAMEYLDGHALSALLDRLIETPSPKFTLWMHIQILCEALSGLHYAHELTDYDGSSLQVVHRDVSPQNVFVTYHGQVKVVDFGVAKAANATVKTQPGMFVGKFSYAAPEQVKAGAVDARTDVFAAGIMLWQAIAGRPFSERVPSPEACRARIEGLEPRIAQVVPTVDPTLARICDRALAIDPDRRYASAKELRSELQEYMQRVGVRIEAAEIGQLMQELFASERRALHARIEQAMRRAGESPASGDSLPILQLADKEPTTVADLSSLVQVSLEQDDAKIQEGYASSKVKLFGKTRWRSGLAHLMHGSRTRLLLVAVLPLAIMVGSLAALLAPRTQPRREVDSNASFATSPSGPELSVRPMPHHIQRSNPEPIVSPPLTASHQEPAPVAPVIAPALNVALDKPARKAPPEAATKPVGTPSPQRGRARSMSTRSAPAPAAQRSEPSEGAAAAAAQSGTQRVYEEGADLPFTRRAPNVRIDSENPYQ